MSTDGLSKARMTPDEIEQEISLLARSGDGADKRWALNKLSGETLGSALAEPLTLGEMEERGSRIMRGMGIEMSKRCFYAAFRVGASLTAPPALTTSDVISKWSHLHMPGTVRKLNQMFPEYTRAGRPRGYPFKGSEVAKREWLVKETCRRLQEREDRDNARLTHEIANPTTPPKPGMDAEDTRAETQAPQEV